MKNNQSERTLINIDVDYELRERIKTAARIIGGPYSQLVLKSAVEKLKENEKVGKLFAENPPLFVEIVGADLEALNHIADKEGVPVDVLAKTVLLDFIATQ